MTKDKWIDKAKVDRKKLSSLISSFHPANLTGAERTIHEMPITAPGAEAACNHIRQAIRKEVEGNPVTQFNEALDAGDVNTANLILSQTWFGVPESTSCWKLEGFREAVDLMGDVPDAEMS